MRINLPNAITSIRIILVPLFIWLIFAFDTNDLVGKWIVVAAFILLSFYPLLFVR